MSPELPDEELVALSKMRDRRSGKAYGFLVVRHEPWVLRMLKNLLRSSEAEEVKQDSFFTGWTQIHKLLENTHFRGWIRSIAVNTAYKKHRRYQLEQKEQEGLELASDSDVYCDHVEAHDAVRSVLLSLEYAHREILVLRYIEELSILEISETLRLGESATKMRLLRARELFKTNYLEATRGRP